MTSSYHARVVTLAASCLPSESATASSALGLGGHGRQPQTQTSDTSCRTGSNPRSPDGDMNSGSSSRLPLQGIALPCHSVEPPVVRTAGNSSSDRWPEAVEVN